MKNKCCRSLIFIWNPKSLYSFAKFSNILKFYDRLIRENPKMFTVSLIINDVIFLNAQFPYNHLKHCRHFTWCCYRNGLVKHKCLFVTTFRLSWHSLKSTSDAKGLPCIKYWSFLLETPSLAIYFVLLYLTL